MKKIVLLTFMLLSGFTLSAQEAQTYVYKSYVLKFGSGIYEIQTIPPGYHLNVSYYPNDKMYIISSIFEKTDRFEGFYRGQLADGRYWYSGEYKHYEYSSREDESAYAVIYTKTPLSSFLYNNGLDANSTNFDELKAIQMQIIGRPYFFIYPIKNKEY